MHLVMHLKLWIYKGHILDIAGKEYACYDVAGVVEIKHELVVVVDMPTILSPVLGYLV